MLIGYYSDAAGRLHRRAPTSSRHTERLGVLLAHRPGFVAPTLAARKLATLDQFSGGRLAVHVISGGSDADQRRDGDFLDHDARYRRTDEYLDILSASGPADGPSTTTGEFYRFEGACSGVRSAQQPHLPIYFGGSSDAAIAVAARHADVYALWGEPLADAARPHRRACGAAAAAHGRALALQPVAARRSSAPTEEAAWDARATPRPVQREGRRAGPRTARAPRASARSGCSTRRPRGDVHDSASSRAIAAATGARGNTTALVGTAEQVAESLLDYFDIGVTTLLIRGFDPLDDALAYGAVVRLVRAEVARRES